MYHLACFACDACKRQLSTGEEFALHDDRLLCRTHYVETATGSSENDGEDGSGHKLKTKRVRTSFTEEQLRILHANFRVDSNPDGQDLERIAQQTGLSKRVTQVWFQNSRARQKKHQQTTTTVSLSHARNNNNNSSSRPTTPSSLMTRHPAAAVAVLSAAAAASYMNLNLRNSLVLHSSGAVGPSAFAADQPPSLGAVTADVQQRDESEMNEKSRLYEEAAAAAADMTLLLGGYRRTLSGQQHAHVFTDVKFHHNDERAEHSLLDQVHRSPDSCFADYYSQTDADLSD